MSGHNVGPHEAAQRGEREVCVCSAEVQEGGGDYLQIVMSRHDARPN